MDNPLRQRLTGYFPFAKNPVCFLSNGKSPSDSTSERNKSSLENKKSNPPKQPSGCFFYACCLCESSLYRVCPFRTKYKACFVQCTLPVLYKDMIKKGNLNRRKTDENQENNRFTEENRPFRRQKKSRRRLFDGAGGRNGRFGQGKRPVLQFASSLKAACAWLPAVSAVFVF